MPPTRKTASAKTAGADGQLPGQSTVDEALDAQPDDWDDAAGTDQDGPLPARWSGTLALLGHADDWGRVLAVPEPGQPPLPQLPLSLYLAPDSGPDDGKALAGAVERVWIDHSDAARPILCAQGSVDHGSGAGLELARRLADGPVPVFARVASDDEDDVAAEPVHHAHWSLDSVLAGHCGGGPRAVISAVWS